MNPFRARLDWKVAKASEAGAEDEEPFIPGNKPISRRPSRHWTLLVGCQWVIIVALCVVVARDHVQRHQGLPQNGEEIYSPVNHLIRYKNVVFTGGFGHHRTEYQGPPTPEREALWEDLYDFGVNRISRLEASQLVNKTVPIPGDEGHYVVTLNVFHQLHCLNTVRKRIWSTETYDPKDELMGMEHIEHCIDAIRQSLMCSADVTPIPWVWWKKDHEAKAIAEIAHTCRNFEDIQEWGKQHRVEHFNRTVYVEDPLNPEGLMYK